MGFYSTTQSVAANMKSEGNVGYVFLRPSPGAVPLYRYYNTKVKDHFYTTNWASLGNAGSDGWRFEGVQAYIYKEKESGSIPLYRYYSAADKDHLYTTNYLGREKDGFKLQGISGYVLEASPETGGLPWEQSVSKVPFYRYYNKATRDHFYTTRKEVLDGGRQGWQYQGLTGYCLKTNTKGAVPLYVYFNTRINDHFYTTDFNQLGKGGKYGWKYEGIECYIYKKPTQGAVPLYRYYNGEVHDHYYTSRWSVLGTAGKDGWKYQGVEGYIYPVAKSS